MTSLSMRPSLALVLLSCVTYHRAFASLCNDGSEPQLPGVQLKKITDSKSDEEEMRPYQKRQKRPSRRYPKPFPDCPSCPYKFAAPLCENAEPPTPHDLSTGVEGEKVPKATVLNQAQREFMPLANVHIHFSAEHKSDSYNNNGTDSEAFDDGATEEYGGFAQDGCAPLQAWTNHNWHHTAFRIAQARLRWARLMRSTMCSLVLALKAKLPMD